MMKGRFEVISHAKGLYNNRFLYVAAQFVKLSRPKQWIKNIFIFPALLFSGRLADISSVLNTLEAFFCFTLISISVYVLNDIVDAPKDRLHPRKRSRPIASEALTVNQASVYGASVFVLAIYLSYGIRNEFLLYVVIYAFINILYSFWLKNIVLVDVFVIAIGFDLRVIAGSAALSVSASPWLLLCTLLLALFLGLSKRRAEILTLQEDSANHREILYDYNQGMIDQLIVLTAGMSIMSYSIYSLTSPYGQKFVYTIPFVIFSFFRYLLKSSNIVLTEDSSNILLGDAAFIISCSLWIASVLVIIYA